MASKVKMVFQTQYADCGLACLVMVSRYYGLDISVQDLRSRYGSTERGLKLDALIEISTDMGMSAVPLKLEIDNLKKLTSPLILHWEFEHYVVATGASKKGLAVNDPTKGVAIISWAEVSRRFTGIALALRPKQLVDIGTPKRRLRLRDIYFSSQDSLTSLIRVILFSISVQITFLSSPIFIKLIMDRAIGAWELQLLVTFFFLFIGLSCVQWALFYQLQLKLKDYGSEVESRLTEMVFFKLLALPLSYFEARDSNSIFLRFDSLHKIRRTVSDDIPQLILATVFGCICLGYLYYTSFFVSLVASVLLLIYCSASFAVASRINYARAEAVYSDSVQKSFMMETISCIDALVINGATALRAVTWKKLYGDFTSDREREDSHVCMKESLGVIYQRVSHIALVTAAAYLVIRHEMTIGAFFAVTFVGFMFVDNATKVVNFLLEIHLVGTHLRRLEDIVLEDLAAAPLPTGGSRRYSTITVEELGFSWPHEGRALFSGVSFHLSAGQSIAIVGSTGCGKTTFLKCILGILDNYDGKIFFDEVNARDINLQDLSKSIGVVMQNDKIFRASILDNITLFSRDVDEQRLTNALRIACLKELIDSLSMGILTRMGQQGSLFSGGEKQRILLARALYKEPAILILDESTSNLDVDTELQVNENLRALNITKIIVAHRPETIRSADHVYDLKNSKLVLEK